MQMNLRIELFGTRVSGKKTLIITMFLLSGNSPFEHAIHKASNKLDRPPSPYPKSSTLGARSKILCRNKLTGGNNGSV